MKNLLLGYLNHANTPPCDSGSYSQNTITSHGLSKHLKRLLMLALVFMTSIGMWAGTITLSEVTPVSNWYEVTGVGRVGNKSGNGAFTTADLTTCTNIGYKTGSSYFTVQTYTAIKSLTIGAQSTSNRTLTYVNVSETLNSGAPTSTNVTFTTIQDNATYVIPKNTCDNEFTINFENEVAANSYIQFFLSGNADIVFVTFESAETVECTEADATFAATATNLSIEAGQTEATTTLTFTKGLNTSDATFAVLKDGKATEDATVAGNVFTATAAGEYTVKATQETDGTYCQVVKEITITVTDNNTTDTEDEYADMTIHVPGIYEKAGSDGGYGQTLAENDGYKYEIYGFTSSGSSSNFITAGTPTTTSTDPNCVLSFATTEQKTNGWISNSVNGRGSSTTTKMTAEFASYSGTRYPMNYRDNNKLILKISGYDQFSILAKDAGNQSSNKYIKISIDGKDVTKDVSTSETVRRYDISIGEHLIVCEGVGGSNNQLSAFSLRLPLSTDTPDPTTHTLSSVVNPEGKATVTLSATEVAEGAIATAEYSDIVEGYKFSSWSISGTGAKLSDPIANPVTITMGTADATITLNLEEDNAGGEEDGCVTLYSLTNGIGEAVVTTSSATVGTTLVLSDGTGKIKLTPYDEETFKKGDKITFTGKVGSDDKQFGVKIYYEENGSKYTTIITPENKKKSDITTLTGELEFDASNIWLNRGGGTATTLTSCVVERCSLVTEPVETPVETVTISGDESGYVGMPVTFTATAEPTADEYKWFVDDAEQSGETAATFTFTPSEIKDYTIKCQTRNEYNKADEWIEDTHIYKANKLCGELIHYELVANTSNGVEKTLTAGVNGILGGKAYQKTENSTKGVGEKGYKLGSPGYYVSLTLASGEFLPGDEVLVYAVPENDNVKSELYISSDVNNTEIIGSATGLTNETSKPARIILTKGASTIYLARSGAYQGTQNPVVQYIAVTRPCEESADNTIAWLKIDDEEIEAQDNVYSYEVNAVDDKETVTVTFELSHPLAKADKESGFAISVPGLGEDPNVQTIVVTAENKQTATYTIKVSKAAALNDNTNLASLTVNGSDAILDKETGIYSYELPYGTKLEDVKVEAVAEDADNVQSVNISDITELPTTVTIVVKAQNGDEKTYTLNLTIAAANAELYEVPFSNGAKGAISETNIRVPYIGEEVPTIDLTKVQFESWADGKPTAAMVDGKLRVTADDGIQTDYTIEPVKLTPIEFTAEEITFDGVPAYIFAPYGWDKDKGVKTAKDLEDKGNRRISLGNARMYIALPAATSVKLTSGSGGAKDVKIFVNGAESDVTKLATANNAIELMLSNESTNFIVVENISETKNKGSGGDAGFIKMQLIKEEPVYTIQFVDGEKVISSTDYKENDVIVPPTDLDEKEGFIFLGWYLSTDESKTIIDWTNAAPKATGNMTFVAKWEEEAKEFAVNITNPQNGTLKVVTTDEEGKQTEVSKAEVGTELTIVAEPADNCYKLKSVSVKNGDEPVEVKDMTFTMPQGDVTVSAEFKQLTFTVTFVDEDGSEIEGTKLTDVKCGSTITVPEAPQKDNDAQFTYTWEGWKNGKETLTAETIINSDVTYTATWTSTTNSYTIIFVNGETELQKETLEFGAKIEYNGETPTKDATAQYTFEFIGWDPELKADATVTSDQTYKAVFESTVNKYTITFKVDGDVYGDVQTVDYGTVIEAPEVKPTKASDDTYNYYFAGWAVEGTETIVTFDENLTLKGNIVFVAVFNKVEWYTIRFVDKDGKDIIDAQKLEKDDPVIVPTEVATITKDDYIYTWDGGWTPELAETAQANVTYTATYTATIRQYDITWVVEVYGDDNVATTKSIVTKVKYNKEPVAPTKEDIAELDGYQTISTVYTFKGWTPEIVKVTGVATYTAVFDSETRKYKITWIDGDGEELKTDNVAYGEMPEYEGDVPTKTATKQFTYEFNGTWSPEVVAVKSDARYTAQFDAKDVLYKVTFIYLDETTGEKVTETRSDYKYEETLVVPKITKNFQTTTTVYKFDKWEPALAEKVTEDNVIYEAQYTTTDRLYTVIFYDEDGTTKLWETTVKYGTDMNDVKYEGTLPIEQKIKGEDIYNWRGWTPDLGIVTEDTKYVARYVKEGTVEYTIRFLNYDNKVLQTSYLYAGDMPKYEGETPVKPSTDSEVFTFAGWDPEIKVVSKNQDYVAQFTSAVRQYEITWVVKGETTVEKVNYGEMPIAPKVEGYMTESTVYTFKGWNPAVVEVTEDARYEAIFDEAVRQYEITWVVKGETTVEKVNYGEMPVAPKVEDYMNESTVYTFKGWNPEVVEVTEDARYEAIFDEAVRQYEITWIVNGQTTTTKVNYGEMPVAPQVNGYQTDAAIFTFDHWTPELVKVTANTTYTAVFTSTVREYQITWKVRGEVAEVTTVAYGEMPVGPQVESYMTESSVYRFNSWSPALTKVTKNATYTATFIGVARKYEITWVVNGEIVRKDSLAYNAMPTAPQVEDYTTESTVFTFAGWNNTIVKVNGDATYTAKFNESVRQYEITWVTNDGTITTLADYGVVPAAPEVENYMTEASVFTFAGWTPELVEVTAEATYTALYDEAVREYEITWVVNGETTVNAVKYGETPVAPEVEDYMTDATIFTFAGWTPEVVAVNGDATYTAVFTETTREYNITWVVNGEETITVVKYGERPVAPVVDNYTTVDSIYTFTGWTPSIVRVKGEATYTAVFRSEIRMYILTLITTPRNGGEIEGAQTGAYEYGTELTITAVANSGYTFAGWQDDPEADTTRQIVITDHLTLTATFTKGSPTSVEEINDEDAVYDNGVVRNLTGKTIYVYSAVGQLVNATDSDLDMSQMQRGAFVITNGNWSIRVVIP